MTATAAVRAALDEAVLEQGLPTDDVLDRLLPLMREVAAAHDEGLVGDLEGLEGLDLDEDGVWRLARQAAVPRTRRAALAEVEGAGGAVHVVGRGTLETDLGTADSRYDDHAVLAEGAEVKHPVHVAGYRTWEGQLGHRDPLVDVFVLGLLLASLACGLDLDHPDDHATLVEGREDLFGIAPALHPVVARCIREMTELERHRRAQDLRSLVRRLESYRDQAEDFQVEQLAGFAEAGTGKRRELVLSRLRERLFDPSRRNRLLYFRSTQQTLDLTLASVPHLLDHARIRPDQLLTLPSVQDALQAGKSLGLSSRLRFEDNPYLAGSLDRIISQAKRDRAEYGFAQLRLVLSFLRWHDLKGAATEVVDSPLLLLPVELVKKRGVRDTYALDLAAQEAEVNPSLRHRLAELYALRLPERVPLTTQGLADFHAELVAQVQASEPAVSVDVVERPRIELIQRQARLRAEVFLRRRAGAAARARSRARTSHSYAREDYRPRGLQLFLQSVRPASLPQRVAAGGRADELRAPAAVAAPTAGDPVLSQATYALKAGRTHGDPYQWEIDLCRLTVGNFNYRRMSLVQDYERLLGGDSSASSFDAVFGVQGRPLEQSAPPLPTTEQHLVIDSDSTQLRAVATARSGRSFIVQGPPGTGKSQTITNLIADYVARGKRVLFVCEKRAAVDVVFHRLRQVGLDELCCLIHDSQADKRAFVHDLRASYEAHLDQAPSGDVEEHREVLVGEVDAELDALHRLTDALRSEVPGTASRALELFEQLVALQQGQPVDSLAGLEPEQAELLPELEQWRSVADAARRLERALADVGEDPVVARHPIARLSGELLLGDRPQRTAGALLTRASRQLDELTEVLDSSRLPVDLVDDLAGLLDLQRVVAGHLQPLRDAGLLAALDAGAPAGRELDALVTAHATAVQRARAAADGAVSWSADTPVEGLDELVAVARRAEGSALRSLRPRWRRAQRLVREHHDGEPESVSAALQLLADRVATHAAVEQLQGDSAQRHGTPDVAALGEHVRAGRALRRSSVRSVSRAVARPDQPDLERLVAAVRDVAPDLDSLSGTVLDLFGDLGEISGGPDEIAEQLAAVSDELDLLPALLEPLRSLAEGHPVAVRALTHLPLRAAQLELASGRRAVDRWLAQDRALARLDGPAVERRVEAVAELRRELLAANAAVIRARVRDRFLDSVRRSALPAGQLDATGKAFKKEYTAGRRELEHEFGKVMRYKPIRDLASGAAGRVVADLKPVWLMSPLSVSDTLPLDAGLFDVVVFDEASQVPVEDAVPALHRAPQVVVVGDRMQLPPTSFFSSGDDSEDELVVEEDGEQVALSLDGTSFLNQSATNLDSVLLAWHYRSRSEALIGFSNAAFYGGELRTIPDRVVAPPARADIAVASPQDAPSGADALLDRPISYHRLDRGVYEGRRNLDEAGYVAALVRELLLRRTGRSIGVVAFSEAQQGAIEEALARLAAEDADFAARLEAETDREEDDQFVGLFVKNLENVQGDERDIVILSICYAPDGRGRMRMNFGPINAADGEKRLNVIFSRAKHHMAVVASIGAESITNDWNDGAAALKGFLRYAQAQSQGEYDVAAHVLGAYLPRSARPDALPASQVVTQLGDALRARGCLVESDLGASRLRCDLAVRLPADDRHRLAVLVDHRPALERDDHERYIDRPRAFSASGWDTTHVLAGDWLADPGAVVDRLLTRLGVAPAGALARPAKAPVRRAPRRRTGPVVESAPAPTTAAAQPDAPTTTEQPAAPTAAAQPRPAAPTRLELVADGSAKFWEVSRDGAAVTVRFGRIGSNGQTQTKQLADADAAARRVQQQVQEKLAKGYRLT